MYEAITRNIKVAVVPHYIEEQSDPESATYLWAYQVEISNLGDETVQLRDRFWKIADANGLTEEVSGPGVVGKQPVIEPGESFTYTSGCPLTTSSGFMMGQYTMVNEDGDVFDVEIPAFALDLPDASRSVH